MVYVEDGNIVPIAEMHHAFDDASLILATAGIVTDWHLGHPARREPDNCSPGRCERVEIGFRLIAPDAHPHALAFADVGRRSGQRICIIYNRITDIHSHATPGRILGHVMAHELCHLLQGTPHHSADGLMKAHWEGPDFAAMAKHYLTLTPQDVGFTERLTKPAVIAAMED
jgi:hypothetical protein